MNPELETLAQLLQKRLDIIADQDLRENKPDEQLKQLQEVSEEITELHRRLSPDLSPRLAHFLDNCSFDKALAWIQEGNR